MNGPSVELTIGGVHVWLIWHRDSPTDPGLLLKELSADEQERAARFLVERPKLEYCITRVALRQLLTRYVVGSACDVSFAYEEHGKPKLAPCHDEAEWLQFNVAHTRDLSAIAVTRGALVGVDVEFQREVTDAGHIVAGKFATEEQRVYSAASASDRQPVFFRGWTRKEAFIKATGEGLSRPLDSFAVTIQSQDETQFLRIDDDSIASWSLFDLELGDGHAGAVAVQHGMASIVYREWKWG